MISLRITKIVIIMFFMQSMINAAQPPLTVLFVTGHFPSLSQPFIMNRIKGLIDLGHAVYIFSLRDAEVQFSDQEKEQYHLHERTFYTLPDHLSCDIIICEFGYHGKRLLEMKAAQKWLEGKKLVTCFRGSDLTAHLNKNPDMYSQVFERCDLILPVCDYFKNILIAIGCNPHKIKVIHSAIDCSLFSLKKQTASQKSTTFFVSVCRLVEKKGLEYAIKAFAQVEEQYPDIRYIIVGDGPEKQNLQMLAQQLGVENKIIFFGWGTQAQVAEILNSSDIFILPSVRGDDGNQEGIPNAIKEAMARGLPVVCTAHAGIPELVDHGVSGFLVPEKDVPALAKKMAWLLRNPHAWIDMGIAGRKKIENEYETKKTMLKLESLLYELCNITVKNNRKNSGYKNTQ